MNKLDTIDSRFRFFKMELIAGEPDYVVEHVSECTSATFCSDNMFSTSQVVVSL